MALKAPQNRWKNKGNQGAGESCASWTRITITGWSWIRKGFPRALTPGYPGRQVFLKLYMENCGICWPLSVPYSESTLDLQLTNFFWQILLHCPPQIRLDVNWVPCTYTMKMNSSLAWKCWVRVLWASLNASARKSDQGCQALSRPLLAPPGNTLVQKNDMTCNMGTEIRYSKLKQNLQHLSSNSSQTVYARKTILHLST